VTLLARISRFHQRSNWCKGPAAAAWCGKLRGLIRRLRRKLSNEIHTERERDRERERGREREIEGGGACSWTSSPGKSCFYRGNSRRDARVREWRSRYISFETNFWRAES